MEKEKVTFELAEAGARVFYGDTVLETLERFIEWYREHQEYSLHVITIQPSEDDEYLTAYYD